MDFLAPRASATPDRPALIWGQRALTYRELEAWAHALAEQFARAGITAGSRVAALLPREPAAVAAIHALARLGAVLVPLNLRLTPTEMRSQLAQSRATHILTTAGTAARGRAVAREERVLEITLGEALEQPRIANEAPESANRRSPFAIPNTQSARPFVTLFTSGTTGTPKAAVLTAANFYWSAVASAFRLGVLPHDRWLLTLPLYHVGGLSILFRSALYGTAVVLPEAEGSFEPEWLYETAAKQRVTLVSLVRSGKVSLVLADELGTVNDLAMCGARPLALSLALILEEGLAMAELWQITQSLHTAAQAVGVSITTGDTKVVDRGKGDGVYINTTGIGLIPPGVHIAPERARPGDLIIINGPIADHGIAIMSVREGLEFETAIVSDSAPLHDLVATLLAVGGEGVHVLRDPTRGGVASATNEIAQKAHIGIRLDENRIPVRDEVKGACEILGFDPLYVANEGKCIAIVAPEVADAVLESMQQHPHGKEAAIIGEVVAEHPGRVFMRSRIGGLRVVDMISGEQLPRIC
jgi:hydrogenase expression/formation protein HypE